MFEWRVKTILHIRCLNLPRGRATCPTASIRAGEHVELISMWVAPEYRGTGLAGRLIDQVVDWASSRDRQTFLMVRDDNLGAIRTCERAGFIDLGVPEGWPDDAPRGRRMRHPGPIQD